MEPIFSKQLLQQTEEFLNKNPDIKSLLEELEKIYSEAKIEKEKAAVLDKVEKLRSLLLGVLGKINEDAYQIAIALAKCFPLNDRDKETNEILDPISLDVIPADKLLIAAYGRHFNIENILKFHEERDTRKDDEVGEPKLIIDPSTNKPFNVNDEIYIKKSSLYKVIITKPKAESSLAELLRVLSEIRNNESESTNNNNNNHHHHYNLPSNIPGSLLTLLHLLSSDDTESTLDSVNVSPINILPTPNSHHSNSNNSNNNNHSSFFSNNPFIPLLNTIRNFQRVAN